MTGWASGCSRILYSPGNLPIPVNLSGIFLSSHQWIWCTWTLMFLLWVALLLLLPVWVLCLLDFCQVEWSQQHSSLGPQLTSHMLGDPREQDQVCLQCTSMSGSCVVGLQECLVARGWGHGRFHTGESETHCRQLAWFAQGPGHLGWFVLDAVVGTDVGVVCYLQIWCQSWHGLRWCLYCWYLQAVWWLCTLHCTAGNWCCWWSSSLGACLLPFHSPLQQWTGLCVGVFLCLALAACGSLPFSQFLKWGWWWDACGLVVLQLWHFTHQWPFFPQPLHAKSWVGHLFLLGVLMGAVGAQCVGCQQLGIMCLVGVSYSMYHMSHTHCSHSWPHSIVCSTDL